MPRSADPQRPRELRITDPHDLRALAHPARQRVLSELYAGEVLTASEAAQLCGLSASAMSYHLRALHRVGLVEPVPSTDGRERPWRKAAETFDVDHAAYASAGTAAGQQQLTLWSEEITSGLATLAQRLSAGSDSGFATSGRVWLTPEEEQELGRDILALWKRYQGRTRAHHPPGSARRVLYMLSIPEADAPAGQDSDAEA